MCRSSKSLCYKASTRPSAILFTAILAPRSGCISNLERAVRGRSSPCLKHITSDNWTGPVDAPEYPGTSRKRLFTTDINGTGPPEHGSWEDILLVQPPITKLGVWRLNSWYGFLGYAQVVTCVPGVTLGCIYKAVRDVVGKHNGLKTAAVYLRGDNLIEVDFVQRWVDALPRTSSVPAGFGFKRN